MHHRAVASIITALTAILGACGSDSADSSAPTPTPTTTTSAIGATEPLVVSWTDAFETPLPNGWTVRDCEGTRTHICVYDGATLLGDIELLSGYPLSAEDDVDDPQGAALAWAQRMVDHFRADRASGCSAFTFEPLEVTTATVGGRPGGRGGFMLVDEDGTVVERVVNHYVVVDAAMTIINTDAYVVDGGCLPVSEYDPSFTPDRLAQLDAGLLDRLVADSPVSTGRRHRPTRELDRD